MVGGKEVEMPTPITSEQKDVLDSSLEPRDGNVTLNSKNLKVVDITPAQDGGVLKEIIKEGEGDAYPSHGCTVFVHYEGRLTDGTVFDSTKKSGQPFEFSLGKEYVIKAWDIGVATMKKGEVAIFTCKPEYAYRNTAHEKIPPNSTLIFEITMIEWAPDDLSKAKDGGIYRTKTLVVGRGYSGPSEGALCEVHLTGRYEGRVFEDRDLKFNLGEGCEYGVIEGIEIALRVFRRGEKSVLSIKPRYAFLDKGNEELGIPGNATVEYTVELKNFEQVARTWDMTCEERVAQAKILKDKAKNYFEARKYGMALKFYRQVSDYIGTYSGYDETELDDEVKSLLLASKLNMALVHLKMNQCYEAKNECDSALEMDPQNVKGLYRRGLAYFEMGEPEKAKLDFEEILKIEPKNSLAVSQIAACCKKIKDQREAEKKIYANMFEKFARKDKEDGSTRYGWWDDEKKEPVIDELDKVDLESIEEAKAEKRKQLEKLKKIAKVRREEKEAQNANEEVKEENLHETKDTNST